MPLRTADAKTAAGIGDERWLLEMIETGHVDAMARAAGWDGTDGLREFCEPDEAAVYSAHASLDDATTAAQVWLATGKSFYGCAIIDHQVFEQWHDDRGNTVKGASWERRKSYEVATDGEAIVVGDA